MRKTWFTKALVALMTLAMVAGVFAVAPKIALADDPSTWTINPATAELAAGESVTFNCLGSNVPAGRTLSDYEFTWENTSDLGAYYKMEPSGNSLKVTATKDSVGHSSVAVNCTVSRKDAEPMTTATATRATVDFKPFAVQDLSVEVGKSAAISANGSIASISPKSSDYYSSEGSNIKGVKVSTTNAVTATSTYGETDDFNVAVTKGDAGLTAAYGGSSINSRTLTIEKGQSISVNASWKGTGTVAWAGTANVLVNGGTSAQTTTSGAGVTIKGEGATTGETVTLTYTNTDGNYENGSVSFTVKVVNVVSVGLNKTSTLSMKTNASDTSYVAHELESGNSTKYYTNLTADSSDTNLVWASVDTTNGTVTLTSGSGNGTATITIGATDSTRKVTFKVTVGKPVIDRSETHYSSNGSGYTDRLNKTYPWMNLHVQVNGAAAGYGYAEVVRSNIRTYIPSNYYSSHPSTYVYRVALNADGFGESRIHAQYNGTTHYTVRIYDANGVLADTYQLGDITVSGYTTMPQTGPDYTWVYVLGGLCVAALAAAVTLNARKKKQREN